MISYNTVILPDCGGMITVSTSQVDDVRQSRRHLHPPALRHFLAILIDAVPEQLGCRGDWSNLDWRGYSRTASMQKSDTIGGWKDQSRYGSVTLATPRLFVITVIPKNSLGRPASSHGPSSIQRRTAPSFSLVWLVQQR
jgi:hypothetical protein